VWKRIYIAISLVILPFFAFIFYLIISIFAAIITISSIDQSSSEFDKSTYELSQKSGQLIEGLNSLSFLFSKSQNVDKILENRHEITKLIRVAPYIFGFKANSNVILCSNLSGEQSKESVSIAYLKFSHGIPFENVFDNKDIDQLNISCGNFYLRFVKSHNDYNEGLYSVFRDYDAFVWISPETMNAFLNIQKLTDNESVPPNNENIFTKSILDKWKLKNFNRDYLALGITAIQNKAIKMNLADQYLNSMLLSSNLILER